MSDMPPPEPEQPGPAQGTGAGLDPKVAALLAYVFGWVSGLILYLIEKENREVRFHAAQSLMVFGGLTVVFVGLNIIMLIPVIGLLAVFAALLLGLASFVLWIALMIKGYNLEHFKLPVVGDMAEEWAAK